MKKTQAPADFLVRGRSRYPNRFKMERVSSISAVESDQSLAFSDEGINL